MKIINRPSFRAVLALTLVLLAGVFLWAGVPALATEGQTFVIAQNAKPIAENLDLSTFRNIAIRGNFEAIDPEGDCVTFEVSDVPKKGSVEPGTDGSFVYTPNENKKGQDSFTYIAIDSHGNLSNKATVTISINKQTTKITYSDMTGNGSYYAALMLAEKDVLTGEKLGNEYFFRPDDLVPRGEFVAMCLSMSGAETLQGITRTGFADDDSIPKWVKPYVSTALLSGIISGYKDNDGKLVFAAQEPITFAEAAVVLDNLLKLTDVSIREDETCAAWSYQAEANVAACNIIPSMGTACCKTVSRAEAADMLVSAMTLLKDRENSGSLLNWAK